MYVRRGEREEWSATPLCEAFLFLQAGQRRSIEVMVVVLVVREKSRRSRVYEGCKVFAGVGFSFLLNLELLGFLLVL